MSITCKECGHGKDWHNEEQDSRCEHPSHAEFKYCNKQSEKE